MPLLSVPATVATQFAKSLVNIANGVHGDYGFGVRMNGGGLMKGELHVGERETALVVRWLTGKRVLSEVAAALRDIEVREFAKLAEPSKGRVIFALDVSLIAEKPDSVIAFMLAAVMESGFRRNIRCCPHKTKRKRCGLWFVDFPKGRDVRKYCMPKHQKAHAVYLSKERNA